MLGACGLDAESPGEQPRSVEVSGDRVGDLMAEVVHEESMPARRFASRDGEREYVDNGDGTECRA